MKMNLILGLTLLSTAFAANAFAQSAPSSCGKFFNLQKAYESVLNFSDSLTVIRENSFDYENEAKVSDCFKFKMTQIYPDRIETPIATDKKAIRKTKLTQNSCESVYFESVGARIKITDYSARSITTYASSMDKSYEMTWTYTLLWGTEEEPKAIETKTTSNFSHQCGQEGEMETHKVMVTTNTSYGE